MKPALATGQPDSQFTHAVSELDRSSRRFFLADDFGKSREPDIRITGTVRLSSDGVATHTLYVAGLPKIPQISYDAALLRWLRFEYIAI